MFYLIIGLSALLIVISPQALIALNLLLIMIRPQEFLLPAGSSGVVMLVLGAAAIAWVIGKKKDLSYPQLTLLTGFYLVLPLSEIMSGNGSDASQAVSIFFPAWLLYLVISSSIDSLEQLRRFVYLLVFLVSIIAVHSIQQYYLGSGWAGAEILIENGTPRVRYLGIFHDPNDLGILFVSALPLAWYAYKEYRDSALRYFFVIALALIVWALLLTKSRGGLLALGFVLMLALWRHFDYFKAGVISVGLAVVGAGLQLRKESLGGGDQSSLDRIDGWAIGMDLFQSNPLFGVGYNHFMDYYFLTAHNSYVLALAETGLFGYLFWVGFLVTLMSLLFKSSLSDGGVRIAESEPWDSLTDHQKISWIFFLSMAGYLFGGFFLSQTYSIFLFLLAAFATSAWAVSYRHAHPEAEDLSEGWKVVPGAMISAVLSIAVLWAVVLVLVKVSYA